MKTYWLYAAVVNAIASLAITFSQIYPLRFQNIYGGILCTITIIIFILIWNFFIAVAVWSIAYNYQDNGIWAAVAINIIMLGIFSWLGAMEELVKLIASALMLLGNLE